MEEIEYLKAVQASIIEAIIALQHGETDKAYTFLINLEENVDDILVSKLTGEPK